MSDWHLTEASHMYDHIFIDEVSIYRLDEQLPVGGTVAYRNPVLLQEGVSSLIQMVEYTDTEGLRLVGYSVKFPLKLKLSPGLMVRVTKCERDPALVGKLLRVDRVSHNGAALLVKCITREYELHDPQGGLY